MSEQKEKLTKNTVRCGHCGNKTLMKIIAEGKYYKTIESDPVNNYEAWRDYHTKNLLCPNCDRLNVIGFTKDWDIYSIQQLPYDSESDLDNENIVYLYPYIKEFADQSSKALDIKNTYREATICFQAELYTSCVVMCRKTMEMLCLYFDVQQPHALDGKLLRMRDERIIDSKLYEWANALRHFGNQAVHSTEKFTKEDSQDILEFTYALVEYCIDFDYKFAQLLRRKEKNKSSTHEDLTVLAETEINILVQALNANEASIRYYTSVTLAQRKLELEKVIPVLLELTSGHKFSSNSISCLKTIGSKAIPELISALDHHSNSNVRSAAATLLGDIGANQLNVVECLIRALKDTNQDVQYKAGLALEKSGLVGINAFVKMYIT